MPQETDAAIIHALSPAQIAKNDDAYKELQNLYWAAFEIRIKETLVNASE